jgi:hypothetical protein
VPGGPRDWSPTGDGSHPTRRTYSSRPVFVRRSRRVHPSAWVSLLLGVAGVAIVLIPAPFGATHGVIVSTVGIAAIGLGLHALRRHGSDRPTKRGIAVLGTLFGTLGTVVMVFQLTTFYLATGGGTAAYGLLGSMPMFGSSTSEVQDSAPVKKPALQGNERLTIAHLEGAIVEELARTTPPGTGWPSSLAVGSSGISVVLPSGQSLGKIPEGAKVVYARSADHLNYSLVIIGPETGVRVMYDTQSGYITTD